MPLILLRQRYRQAVEGAGRGGSFACGTIIATTSQMDSNFEVRLSDSEADIDELSAHFEEQRELLVRTALDQRITDADHDRYLTLRQAINRTAMLMSFPLPFPWPDLRDWLAYVVKWPEPDDRRRELARIVRPFEKALTTAHAQRGIVDWGTDVPGWGAIEIRLAGLKEEIGSARYLDDWQDVGRRARELVIAAVNLVFDMSMVPSGQEVPKGSDAKTKIDYIVASYVPGVAHSELRALLRAAERLCQQVTHASGISRVDALAAAQATILLVRTLQELQNSLDSAGAPRPNQESQP